MSLFHLRVTVFLILKYQHFSSVSVFLASKYQSWIFWNERIQISQRASLSAKTFPFGKKGMVQMAWRKC